MKKHFKDRLKKLADHLMIGKLGHKKFSFCNWNVAELPYSIYSQVEPYSCGYAGCAIGECPIVFKRDWVFDAEAMPVMRVKPPKQLSENVGDVQRSGMAYFGLDQDEFDHLFIPDGQNMQKFGGQRLGDNAKATSVAKNILAFLAKQD